MYLYGKGQLNDSVAVLMTIAPTDTASVWIWRTEYLSEKYPMVKDYKLRLEDQEKGRYALDEGDGIVLYDYLFGNKLYSVFQTQDILLTSSYEWQEDRLIFEVTSGRELPDTSNGIRNYSVMNLQRVVFRKKE